MLHPTHSLISTPPATTFVRFCALNSSILRTHMSPNKSKKRSSGICNLAKAHMAFDNSWGLNSSALASISLAKGVKSSAEPTPSVARAQHVFARPCDVNVDNLAWACFGSWATTCIMSGSRASAVAKAQPARGELVTPSTRLASDFERVSGETRGHCYGLKFEMSWALKCCSRWEEACAKAL